MDTHQRSAHTYMPARLTIMHRSLSLSICLLRCLKVPLCLSFYLSFASLAYSEYVGASAVSLLSLLLTSFKALQTYIQHTSVMIITDCLCGLSCCSDLNISDQPAESMWWVIDSLY